ncbi:MAG: hypothetical protein ACOCZQ_01235, partial [Nanoarchaeota archaeon]
CIGEDDTGKVFVTLWNEQIDQVSVGDKVKFENAYVNEFRGDMQITTGKFGTFEVIGKTETTTTSEIPKKDDEAEEEFIE